MCDKCASIFVKFGSSGLQVWTKSKLILVSGLGQVWVKCGSNAGQVKCGSNVGQVWVKLGSSMVQVWVKIWSNVVQVRVRCRLRVDQVGINFRSSLSSSSQSVS